MAADPSLRVEVLKADYLNKPDVAMGIARQWFDREGVDVVANCNNSAIALAIANLARNRNKVHLNTCGASTDLTGTACTPNLVHWTYDTWDIAHSTGVATVKAGGTKWFFIAADYAFGHAMQRDHIHPAYLLQAKAPAESHGPWDLLTLINTMPADQAFRPLAEGHCPLVPA